MKVTLLSVLLAVYSTADVILGLPINTPYSYAIKDSHNVPRKWSNVGPAPAEHWVSLHIGLKQSRFDELEKQLYEGMEFTRRLHPAPLTKCASVSTLSHPRYGKHLTSTEVNELVRPSDDALEQVHHWLLENEIGSDKLSYTPAKDWINVNLPVSTIERLLDTKYSIYKHEDGSHLVRATSWSLPTHLHQHVDTIQPTNSFFRPSARRSTLKTFRPLAEFGEEAMKNVEYVAPHKDLKVAQACNSSGITPTCLRTLYGTIDYTPKVPGRNQIALNNFLGDTSNRSDVSIFLQKYRPDAVDVAYTFGIEQINGGDNEQTPDSTAQLAAFKDVEGNLDAETIIGMSFPTPLLAYNTGGKPPFSADSFETENTNEVSCGVTSIPMFLLTALALSCLATLCSSSAVYPSSHQLLVRR